MKKIFILLSVFSLFICTASVVSAQTVLTSEQKEALREEIMPAVVEQLSRQFGFDLKSLFKPDMSCEGILRSPFFNPVRNRLRSDQREISVKPDSVVMSLFMLDELFNVKLFFEDYETVTLPDINGYPTTFELPKKTQVKGAEIFALLAPTITITLEIPDGDRVLGGFLITLDLPIGSFDLVDLAVGRLTSGANDVALYVNLDGSRELLAVLNGYDIDLGIEIPPANYQIDIISHMEESGSGSVDVTLFQAEPPGMEPIKKQSEVIVFMDQSKEMPVQAIESIAYDESETAVDWRTYWLSMEQASEQDIVVTIEDYQFQDDRMEGDSTHIGSTFVTTSDYSELNQAALLNRLITQVVNGELPVSHRMTMEYMHGNIANAQKETTMEVQIAPHEDDDYVGGIMHLAIHSPDELKTDLAIEAMASKQNDRVAVTVTPAGESTLATLYFTSNIAVAGNEKIDPAPAFDVAVQDGGLYISNCEKATYSIIDMRGYTLASGLINQDNAYVPIANLPKGVYAIMIKANGKTHSVKFVK
ncbi:MAG: T9SS type A sorting domain-containing protein [Tannerellaceae bacterium]|jgi:hypothetical protein|nr:T9SS type A sorting domain-containing protein [Tannerellaceae bacterium]